MRIKSVSEYFEEEGGSRHLSFQLLKMWRTVTHIWKMPASLARRDKYSAEAVVRRWILASSRRRVLRFNIPVSPLGVADNTHQSRRATRDDAGISREVIVPNYLQLDDHKRHYEISPKLRARSRACLRFRVPSLSKTCWRDHFTDASVRPNAFAISTFP